MVVPAFGFSAGDFIAAVGVLKKTARALRDSGGAASQYQHAVLKLRSLRSALIRLQSLEPASEDVSIVEEIRKCSKTCIIALDKFLVTIEKLDRDLEYKGRKWRKAHAQVKWAMRLEPELRQLEASLDADVQPLQILLQLDGRDSRLESEKVTLETRDLVRHMSNVFENSVALFSDLAVPMAAQLDKLSSDLPEFGDEFSTTMHRIQGSMKNLQRNQEDFEQALSCSISSTTRHGDSSSKTIQFQGNKHSLESRLVIYGQKLGQIDAALLYLTLDALAEQSIRLALILICLMPTVQHLLSRSSWNLIRAPTWLLDNNIRLEDCLGRSMSLPFEHFRHWNLVHAKLEIVLKGTPGERKLRENQFAIFGFGSSLHESNWDAMIYPGASATMSIPFDDETVDGICPSCNSPGLTLCKQEWRCCDQCMFRYRYVDIHTPEMSDAESIEDMFEDASVSTPSLEIRMFRRVHFTHYIESSSETTQILAQPSSPLATYIGEVGDVTSPASPFSDTNSASAKYYCFYNPCASQSKFFKRVADLERHIAAMHNHHVTQLIDCDYPGCHRRGEYGFLRRDKMIEHMRDVHKAPIPKRGQSSR